LRWTREGIFCGGGGKRGQSLGYILTAAKKIGNKNQWARKSGKGNPRGGIGG